MHIACNILVPEFYCFYFFHFLQLVIDFIISFQFGAILRQMKWYKHKNDLIYNFIQMFSLSLFVSKTLVFLKVLI